jgi:putative ABC transport system permease protein
MNLVGPGWFATLGTPLVAGRDFDERDRPGAPRAVIVNRAFVAKYFAGVNPIGQSIREPGRPNRTPAPMEIVGVVADAVYESPRETPPPTMYWPFAQAERAPDGATLTVRGAAGSPAALARSVGAALIALDPELRLDFRPLADIVDTTLAQERLLASLSLFFGALALLLAALGLYGVTAYAVRRRDVELGIRVAIGTTPGGVMRLVLARSASLVGIGLAVGAVASVWASSFVRALLFGVAPGDPATLLGAVVVLALVAAVAAAVPARRAARLDPARVLRGG